MTDTHHNSTGFVFAEKTWSPLVLVTMGLDQQMSVSYGRRFWEWIRIFEKQWHSRLQEIINWLNMMWRTWLWPEVQRILAKNTKGSQCHRSRASDNRPDVPVSFFSDLLFLFQLMIIYCMDDSDPRATYSSIAFPFIASLFEISQAKARSSPGRTVLQCSSLHGPIVTDTLLKIQAFRKM